MVSERSTRWRLRGSRGRISRRTTIKRWSPSDKSVAAPSSAEVMRRFAALALLIGGTVPVIEGQSPSPNVTQDVYANSVRYNSGQSIQPVFEGWSKNPDGSFAMWFGYLNRNYEERPNVKVGPDNRINGDDMGQPEFFMPRRQQFAFKVDVPATFPKDANLVWTVKANGVTLKAYGSLWPVWEVDSNTISANRGSRTAIDFDEPPNLPPQVVD